MWNLESPQDRLGRFQQVRAAFEKLKGEVRCEMRAEAFSTFPITFRDCDVFTEQDRRFLKAFKISAR